jgi:hypothetical protein
MVVAVVISVEMGTGVSSPRRTRLNSCTMGVNDFDFCFCFLPFNKGRLPDTRKLIKPGMTDVTSKVACTLVVSYLMIR